MNKFEVMVLALASMAALSACGSGESPNPLGDPCAAASCAADERCIVAGGVGVCERICDPADATDDCNDTPCTTVCASCEGEHRSCEASAECASATCGACVAGFHEEAGACVVDPGFDCATCADQNRVCDAASERCAGCLSGFFEDAGLCVEAPTCEAGVSGSIAAECEANHRVCVAGSATRVAHCGDCSDGFAPVAGQDECLPTGACLEDGTCADEAQYCVQLADETTPSCAARSRRTKTSRCGPTRKDSSSSKRRRSRKRFR